MEKNKQIVYTPMIEQYLQIKRENPELLIMYRLGDFYEFFFEDAEKVSKVLQLVLTKKSAGNNQKIPMCGIPHHASQSYLAKLIDNGFKVGIVEQLEEAGSGKGIVRRDIVQIVTPGSIVDYEDSDHNYISAISENEIAYFVSYADVLTGDIFVTTINHEQSELISVLHGLNTKEIVVSTTFNDKLLGYLKANLNIVVSFEDDSSVSDAYSEILANVTNLDQIKIASTLINYLNRTKRKQLSYLKPVEISKGHEYLQIDSYSRLNLELTRTVRQDSKYGSLFWLLDETGTAMGRRKLKDFINRPSRNLDEIVRRQNIVNSFIVNYLTREEVKEHFVSVYDLERIVAKISFGSAHPKDLLRLKTSLQAVDKAKSLLQRSKDFEVKELCQKIGEVKDIISLIEEAISEEAPLQVNIGEIFKYGYNASLDELIDLSYGGKKWISALEEKEKEKTGIKNLKIGYNRVFGYYIEISNSFLPQVKDEFGYIRKQTTKNGERFINEELKEKEILILSAEEKRQQLEKELFNNLLAVLQKSTRMLQKSAEAIAEIDVYLSLATIAVHNNFVRPSFNERRTVTIKEAKHPILTKLLKGHDFVANDIIIDEDIDVLIITGPNMGGKSTLMRQLALIVVLAQMGSFVPAASANLMIFDQIFTRIGASDDLISGQSTFMVEMVEANFALRKATSSSLILFDEIGRGTATYDGMALAYSIIEYIATKLRIKTLFSTHYHEITKIENYYSNVKNIHVEVKEVAQQITFLYKINEGPMNKSYGINVARLAGLPRFVLERADEHLAEFSKEEIVPASIKQRIVSEKPLWQTKLEQMEINELSPLEALLFLKKIKDGDFD